MTREKIEECAASGRETLMTEIVSKRGSVSGRTAFDAMRAQDEAAREVVDTYVKYLVSGLSSMINIFQPEILCIGGGISGEGQTLIDLIKDGVYREQYGSGIVRSTKLCIAELGNDAGIIGAALLDD